MEGTAPTFPFIPPGSSTCVPPESASLLLMELRLVAAGHRAGSSLRCIINQAEICSTLLFLLSRSFSMDFLLSYSGRLLFYICTHLCLLTCKTSCPALSSSNVLFICLEGIIKIVLFYIEQQKKSVMTALHHLRIKLFCKDSATYICSQVKVYLYSTF